MDDMNVRRRREVYKRGNLGSRVEGFPFSREELTDLQSYLERILEERDCSGQLALTRRWSRAAGLDSDEVRLALESVGAFCDCEVLLNVNADDLFPPPVIAR